MRRILFLGGLVLLVFVTTQCTQNEEIEITRPIETQKPNQTHTINTVLWHQTAAEYKALCYQTYNLAKIQLEQKLEQHAYPYELPPAIIMDLDETVIDNSFFNAQLILDSAKYNRDRWLQWSDLKKAGAVPGAIEFIQYAQSKDVKVIFISNRRVVELANTKINLENLGVENLETSDFYLKADESSKMPRRSDVMKHYDVLMLFGDNLADFSEVFDKRTVRDRNALVDSLRLEFGSTFIVLPNVLYGEWESSLNEYQYDWTPNEKDSIRKSWLKGY